MTWLASIFIGFGSIQYCFASIESGTLSFGNRDKSNDESNTGDRKCYGDRCERIY